MSALELKNVYFRYGEGEPTILRDVNYTFEYGKVYLLYGNSGEGKSTILSLLNGRIPFYHEGQFKGEILHDGQDIYELDIAQRSRFLSSLFQNPDEQILFDRCEDEVAFPLENVGVPENKMKEIVWDSLKRLNLNPKDKTRTLSGGEKQRLEASCALSLPNRIFLLDEPLANLDKEASELLLKELKRRAKEDGACIIIIEHRLDRIAPYVDEGVLVSEKTLKKSLSYLEGEKKIEHFPSFSSEKPILSCTDLVYRKDGKNIIDGVSLTLHQGERLLLLGDNGAGKTTLLRMLSKLIKPTKGKVESPLYKGKRQWFSSIGYLFQNPDYQLFCKSVREEVFLTATDEDYANYLLEKFGLSEMLEKHPLSLSEGQKRKLTFVSVLSKKPAILFLDEPTVGQDDNGLRLFVEEVNKLVKEERTSVITITHDRRCMEALADRTITLENGRLSQ